MSNQLFFLSATVELPISRPPEEARSGRVGHLSTHCCTAHGSLVELFVKRCPRRAPKLARCGRAGAPFRVAEACANEVVHGQPARCRLSHQLDERWLSPLAEGGKRRDGREGQVRDVLLKEDRASSGCVHELHHELSLLALVEQLVHDIAALDGVATQTRRSTQQT